MLLVGYVLHRQSRREWSGAGLALIGIALMLLSLALLSQATVPLRRSPAMAAFLAMLGNAWPVALAFAAGLAVICSSSLAVVMLILSLGADPALTVVLVLGANLGGAIPPLLATAGQGVAARRVTLGNLVCARHRLRDRAAAGRAGGAVADRHAAAPDRACGRGASGL